MYNVLPHPFMNKIFTFLIKSWFDIWYQWLVALTTSINNTGLGIRTKKTLQCWIRAYSWRFMNCFCWTKRKTIYINNLFLLKRKTIIIKSYILQGVSARGQGSHCNKPCVAPSGLYCCFCCPLSVNSGGYKEMSSILGCPIAPSYMSPIAGGVGESRGLSQWVQCPMF